jgi:iron complex transport system permease protein
MRSLGITAFAIAALAAAALLSLAVGSVWMNPLDALQGAGAPGQEAAFIILGELRAPRTVLAIVAGATMGLCGAVLQGLLRNPLADPGLLGVAPGASLGAVLAIFYGYDLHLAYAAPMAGMAGALLATALTYVIGRGGTTSLILAGAAVSGLAGAGVALALNFAPSAFGAIEIMNWLMGSIADRSWEQVRLAAPLAVAGWVVLAFSARALDALALGEAQAASLGVDLDRLRALVLVGVALSVGSVTSVAGSIGFIGLAAPHLVRPFVGHQPSRTLLPSALVGAVLLLLADICARLLRYNGEEIRLGVLTSLIGTPFFFWLVIRLKRLVP